MDILDVIKREHREVSALIDQVEKCAPGDERLRELASEISAKLVMHLEIEERLFYAKLRARAEEDDERVDIYEAYTEHDVATHCVELVRSKRKPDEKFKAELQVLGESVKHHVREEESKVFKIGKQFIDPEEREQLGEQWQKMKQRMETRGSSTRGAKKTTAPRKKSTAKRKTTTTRKRR